MVDVEHLLHRQRQRIQRDFQVHYGFDPLEPHFVNEIRAFYNRPHRRNTQIRFSHLARDTGYRQRQYQQGGAPPPQPQPIALNAQPDEVIVQESNQENPTHNETRNHSGHAREHASPVTILSNTLITTLYRVTDKYPSLATTGELELEMYLD